jgi:phosphoribosylformimino-5-aminoimidazole carboxamide ribotide isomerase
MNFRLIFVMDLLDGVVVHAKRGERDKYVPIHRFSSIVTSSDPVRVLESLKPREVYIADLNRLMNTGNNRPIVEDLRARNSDLAIMLDYGVKGMGDLKEAVAADLADKFVLGTETSSIELLEAASKSSSDIIVSVDLFNNEVLTSDTRMKIEPLQLIKELNKYPVRDVILLELNRVGTKSGIDFEFLARAVALSEHDILCGGGVRNCDDVYKMKEIGVKGALVATAVHDGGIPVFIL